MGKDINYYVEQIKQWHYDRNLIDGSTDPVQYIKLIEESGELAGNISRERDIRDDIGDNYVVLINLATRNNLDLGDLYDY